MFVLALDTSTEIGTCALWADGEINQIFCPERRSHSETLLDGVRQLLAEAGIGLCALSGIAFGCGPGAFTGLRVACGIAQGLALGADQPLVPVGSLNSIAAASGADRCLALLDARMGEVYGGHFEKRGDELVSLSEIHVDRPDVIELPDTQAVLAGNALRVYATLAQRAGESGHRIFPDIVPTAEFVVRLAVPRLVAGDSVDPAMASPLYVRNKVAKTIAERESERGKA